MGYLTNVYCKILYMKEDFILLNVIHNTIQEAVRYVIVCATKTSRRTADEGLLSNHCLYLQNCSMVGNNYICYSNIIAPYAMLLSELQLVHRYRFYNRMSLIYISVYHKMHWLNRWAPIWQQWLTQISCSKPNKRFQSQKSRFVLFDITMKTYCCPKA